MRFSLFVCITFSLVMNSYSQKVEEYFDVIQKVGKEPVSFINEQIERYDLILFDDALHSAVEPFEFYVKFLEKHPEAVDYIFLEVFSTTTQIAIDSFLQSKSKDILLLAEAFQQGYSYGWPYETYLTLFSKVWDINQKLPKDKRIKIIGVNQPIYWEGLHSREDYTIFQASLVARDYFMYKTILKYMDNFDAEIKGLFLTNTRHAYKGIKNKKGEFYWNTGTFFHQWHPGKSYSVRFHNMNLFIESVKDVSNPSTQGLDRINYKWVRMAEGLWDRAFEMNSNKPVAIPFQNNVFGKHPYIGNHMANALDNQTMWEAYDALIFLKPLQQTKFSAHTNFFYTDEFKTELSRRVKIINGDDLDAFLKDQNVTSVDEFISSLSVYVPEKPNPLVRQ